MSHKNQTRRAASDDDSDVEQELQNKKFKNNGGSANGYNSKSKSNTRRDDSDSDSDNEHQSKGKAAQKADRKTESKNRHDSSEEEEKQGGKKNDGAYEVIIRGLPYASSDQDLSDFFQDCGEIERVNLLKGPDGRSKGIAFVKFSDEQALQKAIGLTGSDLGGRTVTIEKTIPKEQRGGDRNDRGGDRNQQRSERDPTSTTVFIGNLSYQTNEDSIRDLFESCGKIKEVRVATDQDGRPRGFGYVEFGSPDSVDKAIGKTGAKLDGRSIRVDFANSKKNDGGRDGGRDGGNRSGGYGGGRNGGGRSGGYGGDRRSRY